MESQVKSKKFINAEETVVQESIRGLGIQMAEYIDLVYQDKVNDDEIPIVSIKKEKLLGDNKVRIVCGGGSGHEPAHGGYVCQQMLSAAVCGRVFASPSLQQVRRTLEWMIQDKKDQQILVIVKNYTGDIINFNSGVKMAEAQYQESHNVKIKCMFVGDDVAIDFPEGSLMKPRGVAGTSLLYKILGGASYEGMDLDKMVELGDEVLKNLSTFGTSMESCSLPGKAKSHDLKADEIEIGMGIHGEPGREKVKWIQNHEIVKTLIDRIEEKNKFSPEIVVMINSLGNVTNLEMTLITNDVMNYFKAKNGVKVVRLISGGVMTSLDMNGISITVLNLDKFKDDILKYIDLPVDSPAWPPAINTEKFQETVIELGKKDENAGAQDVSGSDDDLTKKFRAHVKAVLEKIISEEPVLTKMDADVGDGDLGIGAARASKNCLEILNTLDFQNDLKGAVMKFADKWSDGFGGSSGPLWGAFICHAATKLPAKLADAKNENWSNGFVAGTKAMMEVGGAKKGMRTMIDALVAGEEYLSTGSADDKTLEDLGKAVRAGADAAKALPGGLGRSGYLEQSVVVGKPEPGCELTSLIVNVPM